MCWQLRFSLREQHIFRFSLSIRIWKIPFSSQVKYPLLNWSRISARDIIPSREQPPFPSKLSPSKRHVYASVTYDDTVMPQSTVALQQHELSILFKTAAIYWWHRIISASPLGGVFSVSNQSPQTVSTISTPLNVGHASGWFFQYPGVRGSQLQQSQQSLASAAGTRHRSRNTANTKR